MQQDTIHLLADCSAGIKMALATIDGILPEVRDYTLREKLKDSISTHHRLQDRTQQMLRDLGGQDKSPSPMARGMSWLVTNAKMALGDDTTAAYLVADGCDMGVKSLCRSRNRYPAANSPQSVGPINNATLRRGLFGDGASDAAVRHGRA